MGTWDLSLTTEHNANPVDCVGCWYNAYRTKDDNDALSLLYDTRTDFIKRLYFERFITSLFLAFICGAALFAAILSKGFVLGTALLCVVGLAIFLLLTYYLVGYVKQRNKCRMIENKKT